MNDFTVEFPHLFQKVTWPSSSVTAQFKLLNDDPPHHLVGNVNIVPWTRHGWLLLKFDDGSWEIPGGTIEPGENYIDTITRELIEEAGARLQTFHLFGAWHCFSMASKPYRPHLPFPEFYRIVGVGEVEVVQAPGNPADGERISLVDCVPLATAVKRFISIKRYDLAELYLLASKQSTV